MNKVAQALFNEVYRRHAPIVYRYCLFRTNSREQSEDATAEVFAELVRDEAKLESDHLVPWLLRVAANRCADEARRAQRERRSPALQVHANASVAAWRDTDVWAAVARLNEAQQKVIYLRIVEDLSFGKVAELFGKSEPATKMLFYRGIRKLARLLGRSGGDAHSV